MAKRRRRGDEKEDARQVQVEVQQDVDEEGREGGVQHVKVTDDTPTTITTQTAKVREFLQKFKPQPRQTAPHLLKEKSDVLRSKRPHIISVTSSSSLINPINSQIDRVELVGQCAKGNVRHPI